MLAKHQLTERRNIFFKHTFVSVSSPCTGIMSVSL